MTRQNRQNIEIVGNAPVHTVCADIGGEVKRVDKEHNAGRILVLLEELTVVARNNLQSGKIVRARFIPIFADIVIECFAAHAGEHTFLTDERKWRGKA